MGGSGGKQKSAYTNPVQIQTQLDAVFLGAVKGYAGLTGSAVGGDLSLDSFIEAVSLEVERADASNIGHPNYKPVMVRRHGFNRGKAEISNLAYDPATGQYAAFNQLQEGMRIIASSKLESINDYTLNVGDTIALDEVTMGSRRLWLIDGIDESDKEITFDLIDVLGG